MSLEVLPKPVGARRSSASTRRATHAATDISEPKRNRLLAALPDAEMKRWQPELEPSDMPLGYVLYESGKTEHCVYFPTSAIVSLL
jgi:hypothetical protein